MDIWNKENVINDLWRVIPLFPGLIPTVAAFFVTERGLLLEFGFMLFGIGVLITGYRVIQTVKGLAPEGGRQ